jgi:hypothetical protein
MKRRRAKILPPLRELEPPLFGSSPVNDGSAATRGSRPVADEGAAVGLPWHAGIRNAPPKRPNAISRIFKK